MPIFDVHIVIAPWRIRRVDTCVYETIIAMLERGNVDSKNLLHMIREADLLDLDTGSM